MEQEKLKAVFSLAVLGVAGLFVIYRGFVLRRRAQRMADLARSKSSSAPQGLVELEGFAWSLPHQTLTGLQGRPCVFHSFSLQKEVTRGSGKNRRKEWVTVFFKSEPAAFLLIDPAGAVRIATSGMETHLQEGIVKLWTRLTPVEKSQALQVIPAGTLSDFPPSEGFFGQLVSSKFRILYEYIPLGSPLHVTGHLESSKGVADETLTDPSLLDFASKVIDFKSRSVKSRNHYLDADRNGRVTEIESRRGYQNAAELSWKKAQSGLMGNSSPTLDLRIHGNVMRSDQHALTVIDAFEEHALRRLSRKSWGTMALGFAITMSCLLGSLAITQKMGGSAAAASSSEKAKKSGSVHHR